ncbi:MAG: hypothetical protein H7Y12_15065, partial [Sphingobacteriaceae bacterium]|nr:hypothetical protein [Cytophagaceae bacterium]
RDINRTFELTGVAGGQRVFYYEPDTKKQVLYLQDKNRGSRNQENREFLGNNRDLGGNPESAARPISRREGRGVEKAGKADNWIPQQALASIGPEDPKIEPIARSTRRTKGIEAENRPGKRNRFILKYKIENGGDRVLLTGTDERKRPIEVTLDRYAKKYALSESTLKAGKYE